MNNKTKDIVLISLFAALIAIGAFIRIPIGPVPFTMQFLFCAYAGVLLGSKRGLYAMLLYLSIGLVGIPIFTKGGGISYIFQPTFGYLIGFTICAFIVGRLTEKLDKITFIRVFIPVVLGLMVVYTCGVSYMYIIVNYYFGKQMVLSKAIALGFTPFIIPDLFWSTVIGLTSTEVVPILRKLGYVNVKKA